MSPKNIDGVMEAVYHSADGCVEMARLYGPRGAVFSDRVVLSRDDLVRRIKTRTVFVAGKCRSLQGTSFDLSALVCLAGPVGNEGLISGSASTGNDPLEGILEF